MATGRQHEVITLLSDFGTGSDYVAAMKGVILNIAPDVRLIDLSHEVPRHGVRAGAFLLRSVAPYFPRGTVHIAVVDPGVGTERKGLIVAAGGQYLVGPDNGLLFPAAERLGLEAVYEISSERYMLPNVSVTFHGRDVFAPIGAHLARGVPLEEIGRKIDRWVGLSFGRGRLKENRLVGKVIYIDSFGNVITDIPGEMALEVAEWGRELEVIVRAARVRVRLLQAYGLAGEGELILLIGSHGNLELAVNRGSAAELLGPEPGDELEIRCARRDER